VFLSIHILSHLPYVFACPVGYVVSTRLGSSRSRARSGGTAHLSYGETTEGKEGCAYVVYACLTLCGGMVTDGFCGVVWSDGLRRNV
jgi:hypothetical protein